MKPPLVGPRPCRQTPQLRAFALALNHQLMKSTDIAFAIISNILPSCGESREALPNGFEFVELSGQTGAIAKYGNFVVYPNVADYEVQGNLVRGKRVLATDNGSQAREFTSNLGYFTLDTTTGVVRYDALNEKVTGGG